MRVNTELLLWRGRGEHNRPANQVNCVWLSVSIEMKTVPNGETSLDATATVSGAAS